LYRLIQASGGGFGDPIERDVYAIEDDVQQEKLTVDYVRQEYSVVIDPLTLQLDLDATEALRSQIETGKNMHGAPVGSGEARWKPDNLKDAAS
jgi:N-methylhydantoinase B/oxoprolinase/acetone carboxylase alpha subunit